MKKLLALLLAAALCLAGCSSAKGGLDALDEAPSSSAPSSSASSSRVSSSASSSQVSSSSSTSSTSSAATSEKSAAPAPAPQQSVTVYVTKTGEKYHRAGCQYLKKSCIPISLDDAKRSYSPCSKCNPPR